MNKDFGQIYLASPYSSTDYWVRGTRHDLACSVAASLIGAGFNVFCPIAHSHIVSKFSNPGHEAWMKIDLAQLVKSKVLVVLQIRGWTKSRGVAEEIQFAVANNIPVVYLRYKEATNDWLHFYINWAIVNSESGAWVSKQVAWPQYLKENPDYKGMFPDQSEEKEVTYNAVHDLCLESEDKIELKGVLKSEKSISLHDLCEETPPEVATSTGKGIKAQESKNKPSILNYPWGGDNWWMGSRMAQVIQGYLSKDGRRLRKALDKLDCAIRVTETDPLKINEVFNMGAKKHGSRTFLNYDKSDLGFLIEALGRHLLKGPHQEDEESGLLHKYHILANIMMIRLILNKGESK